MTRWLGRLVLLLSITLATLLPAEAALADFTDVPSDYWDYTAIVYVGQTNTWMQDYGATTFKPTTLMQREYVASSLVKAYAASEPIDPKITFSDLPSSDPFYPYANVAVKLGWITKYGDGRFGPVDNIKVQKFDKALVLAMGSFGSAIDGLASIHQLDGDTYSVDSYFPYLQLSHWLGLHYNHSDEALDLNRDSYLQRDEAAYSLWAAKTVPSWKVSDASMFDDIELPGLDPNKGQKQKDKENVTAYALGQMGFPYVYGGEWNVKSPTGYCCGSQPIGGMDCSGFTWWVMKKNESNYNAAQYHPDFAGWPLPERSSADMAAGTINQVSFDKLNVGDLMFFASGSVVDHVGLYLGKSWMIHSASSNDGVVIDWVGDGYYQDTFVYGRHLIGGPNGTPPRHIDMTVGDGPREGGDPAHPAAP